MSIALDIVNSSRERREKKNEPIPEPKVVEKTIIQKADTTKIEAVTKIAYDKASTALDVANNQADLIKQLTKAVKSLQPNKSFSLSINRDRQGFISTIDITCK
jgi:hypothetical protein